MSFDVVHTWLQQVQHPEPPESIGPPAPSNLIGSLLVQFHSASIENNNSTQEGKDMESLPPLSESNYGIPHAPRVSVGNGGSLQDEDMESLPPLSESHYGVPRRPQESIENGDLLQEDKDMESLPPLSESDYGISCGPHVSVRNGGLIQEDKDMESLPPLSESDYGVSRGLYVSVRNGDLIQEDAGMESLSSLSESCYGGSESKAKGGWARRASVLKFISATSELAGAQKSDVCMSAHESTDEGLISNYSASSATSEEAEPWQQHSAIMPIPPLPIEHNDYSIAQVLGDPWFWASAWSSLKLLTPSSPVPLCILDYHFMAEWLEIKEALGGRRVPSAYYIDTKVLRNLGDYSAGESILHHRLFISPECATPMHPVFFFNPKKQDLGEQLFILDFSECSVLVLGGMDDRTLMSSSPQLDQLWFAIARWFGWSTEPLDHNKVFYRGWTQGDLKFGPRAASLFESAVRGEWIWSKDIHGNPENPSFQCDRLMLQQIFMRTLSRCLTYTQHWRTLHVEKRGVWQEVGASTMEEVNIGLLNFKWVTRSATVLCRNIQTCRTCTERSSHLPGALPHAGHTSASTLNPPIPEILDEKSENSEGSDSSELDLPALSQEHHLSAQNGTTYEQGDEVWHFDKDDDDYETAPLQPLKCMPPQSSNIWVFGRGGRVPLLPSGLFNWTDRGFRTTGLFFRTIHTAQPAETTSQTTSPPPPPADIDRCRPSPHKYVLPISGREMLDRAGVVAGADVSHRIFVRGKEERGPPPRATSRYLALDLEKDGVDVAPDCVKVSVDLDSLIWVTTAANFTVRSFEIFLTPKVRPGVGIDKNNFIYVNLLSPPTNTMELGDPMLRARKQVPLSRIPHLEFGYCGQGSRRINFFAFFPRMIWKNDKGRYATRLPGQLTDLWYESAILAACRATYAKKPGFSEYLPHSLQEIRDRTGMAKQKEINIAGGNQKRVMEELCRIIKEGDSLSCFGSFFIVADGRGMKFTTKQCVLAEESAPSFDLIKAEFADLDWDVMQDRGKGELYLDIGTGYHSEHQVPLVGFWRLPSLLDAFGQMESKKPTTFNFGTQKFHGGMSAEMSMKAKTTSHLISKINYCLAFEVVRNPGTSDYICSDVDVVGRTTRFHTECQKWLALTSAAVFNPYGVREEVRGLAGIVLKRLEHSGDQTRKFLDSKPILWVPSATYFGIVCRRFRELLKVHERCFDLRVPNYRLMSTLLAYLLRQTMVIPRVKYPELGTALQHLRFKETITICGIFFLHGLHSKSMRITGLLESDSAALAKAFKIPFVKKKSNPQHSLELLPLIEAGGYPWGMELSESTIKTLLNESNNFMKHIDYVTGIPLLKHPLSSRLFIIFTAQVWMMLAEDFVQRPELQFTLNDAISQWTQHAIKQGICKNEVIIHPTYDTFSTPETKSLRPKQLFANRKQHFFPDRDAVEFTPCSSFAKNPADYLSLYYEFLETGDPVSIQDLENDLELIFGVLPLLPASQVNNSKSKFTHDIWKTTKGKIEFVANSIYFKCTSVTFKKDAISSKVKTRRAKLNQSAITKRMYENTYGPNSYPKRHEKGVAAGKSKPYRRRKK